MEVVWKISEVGGGVADQSIHEATLPYRIWLEIILFFHLWVPGPHSSCKTDFSQVVTT